jgi:hypothetical protein
VRLVEFLIQLLEAQAHTLHRLAALFSEEMLLHMLEESGDTMNDRIRPLSLKSGDLLPPNGGEFSAYAALEGAVHDFKLPAVLEFHLWAYPTYRRLIEGDFDLNARIPGPGGEVGTLLVEETVERAEEWVKGLPIASEFALQAQQAAHVPWLRFRTQVLKRIGKRPMGPVL